MVYTRRRALQMGAASALGLLIPAVSDIAQADAASAATSVTLSVSGMAATISNGYFTIKFNSSGTGYSFVYNSQELIGSAKGFYCSINGGTAFSPTSISVVTNTSSLVDIAYTSTWGDLHYVVRSGVSGLYSYFVASGISTVSEFRTLYRVDGNIFQTGYNGVETAITLPTASELAAATVLQDSTYELTDGTIYTKYDAATYLYSQDSLHGVYSSSYGVWMISPSHEYVEGGPLKQDLTVHVDESTGDAVVLNMLVSAHFGTPSVTIPSGKIFGPWFVYFNDGSISDAQSQATTQKGEWPYTWLSNSHYPTSRYTVTGTLVQSNGLVAAGATVVLAASGGDVYAQGAAYIFYANADSSGYFSISGVRDGTYSLYAWANGGTTTGDNIGSVADQYEKDSITVSGASVALGTLTWSTTHYTHSLWQIGTAAARRASSSSEAWPASMACGTTFRPA
jgi:rhamnogalacturonan endolyase